MCGLLRGWLRRLLEYTCAVFVQCLLMSVAKAARQRNCISLSPLVLHSFPAHLWRVESGLLSLELYVLCRICFKLNDHHDCKNLVAAAFY